MKKIRHTHPTKVNGKLVKYRIGDCLSVKCNNGQYLGVLISNKFNKYYDLTLIKYYESRKPTTSDFQKSVFFGTRLDSDVGVLYAVDAKMLSCKIVDTSDDFEKVGCLNLNSKYINGGYAYINDITNLEKYYLDEIDVRKQKTLDAKVNPDLGFAGRHLIEIENILAIDDSSNKIYYNGKKTFVDKFIDVLKRIF